MVGVVSIPTMAAGSGSSSSAPTANVLGQPIGEFRNPVIPVKAFAPGGVVVKQPGPRFDALLDLPPADVFLDDPIDVAPMLPVVPEDDIIPPPRRLNWIPLWPAIGMRRFFMWFLVFLVAWNAARSEELYNRDGVVFDGISGRSMEMAWPIVAGEIWHPYVLMNLGGNGATAEASCIEVVD